MVSRNLKSYKVTYLTPYSKGRHGVAVEAYTAQGAINKIRKETPSATKVKIKKGVRAIELYDYDSGKTTIKRSKLALKGKRTSKRRKP